MWNIGSTSSSRSSGSIAAGRRILASASMLARIAPWLSIAPLGWPSLPEVYMSTARSLATVLGGANAPRPPGPAPTSSAPSSESTATTRVACARLATEAPTLAAPASWSRISAPASVHSRLTSVAVYPVLIGTATIPARSTPK